MIQLEPSGPGTAFQPEGNGNKTLVHSVDQRLIKKPRIAKGLPPPPFPSRAEPIRKLIAEPHQPRLAFLTSSEFDGMGAAMVPRSSLIHRY